MSLIDDIKVVKSRVQDLSTVTSGLDESRALQQRLRELQGGSSLLSERVAQLVLFRTKNITIPPPPPVVDQACKRVENVKKRFTDSREAKSLTQGNDWNYLNRYLGETGIAIDVTLATTWKNYIQELFTGESPNDLNRTLAPTDANKEALDSYIKEWQALRGLAKCLPE